MYNKVQLLLHGNKRISADRLETKLASETSRMIDALPAGTTGLRAIRLPDDPTRNIAHGKEIAESAESFDAVVEVGADNGDPSQLAVLIRDAVDHLGEWIEPARSAVIAGSEHVILPGREPLMLILAIRRLSAMTDVAYHDYWLNKHAAVARRVPVLRAYHQFHANESATREIAKSLGIGIADFNGAAQGYFRDVQDFLDIMAQPEVTADALEDEKHFIDHARSVMGLFRIIDN